MEIELSKIWNATLDLKTRPNHGAMDGVKADENDEWFVYDSIWC